MILPLALFLQLNANPSLEPDPAHFRYQRAVSINSGDSQQACAILPGDIFAHAAPTLADLRLYTSGSKQQQPYALTLSEAASPSNDPAALLNLGTRSGHIAFDLQMPPRPYTSVVLDLNAKDFLATAKVFGQSSPGPAGPITFLGDYTLFDLTGQRLSRSTTLNLQESTFPQLHIDLTVSPAPNAPASVFPASVVAGASVPPSREAQTLYTRVAETSSLAQRDHTSVATFHLAARIPVERVEFVLQPGFHANFSRSVVIMASSGPHSQPEEITGQISRIELTEGGHTLRQLQLTVPATLGANMQAAADVQVAIQDGDDRPLAIAAVRLEMRQRQLCFEPAAGSSPATLFYGDPDLRAPSYDYARLFVPNTNIRAATLGPEQLNPAFIPRADTRPFSERHPELLWVALIAVILVLGFLAFRSAKHLPASR
jgi:hypothetical protein